MTKSEKSIYRHIPDFLQYCKNNGLSKNTQNNYSKFLGKFLFWLSKEKYDNLLPHELTDNYLSRYQEFLKQPQNGKILSIATQNYYLIALRSLLDYFGAQEIESLPKNKITLPNHYKNQSGETFLNFKLIEKILSIPDTKTDKGIRDRAILECILSTGVRINELVSLNIDLAGGLRDKGGIIQDAPFFYSDNVRFWINKYLKIRNKYCSNGDKAFFIHLNSGSCRENRLTAESIERLVKKYGQKIAVDLKITPEVLRKSYFRALFNEEIQINDIHFHDQITISDYPLYQKESTRKEIINQSKKGHDMSWNYIEKNIEKEIIWLQNNITVMPDRFRGNHTSVNCSTCLFRKIAGLIVSGKTRARQLKFEDENIWKKLTNVENFPKNIRHGKEWHRKVMNGLINYFEDCGAEVEVEPRLNYGRADLKINKDSNFLFIEVGTISPFKLWFNLMTMGNSTFHVIPDANSLIEFRT